MRKERFISLLKYLFIILLAFGSLYLVFAYVASDYPSFISGVLVRVHRTNRFDHYMAGYRLLWPYKALKYILLLYVLILFISLYNALVHKRGRLLGWLNGVAAAVYAFLQRNKTYWVQLDPFAKKGLFFVGAIQFVAFLFFLLSLPFHYDEAYSYAHFAGVGFVQTAAWYPYPNNHIFFNLVSRLFSFLPFQPEITSRLPSFFASLISTWYFFKLAQKYFTTRLTLFITILFLTAFPVIMYSVEGRGYGFVVCFTVLLFYAADQFAQTEYKRRYGLLYLTAVMLGLYTVPSFLFPVLSTGGIAGCYLLLRKQWRSLWIFILDNAIGGVAAALLYLPIIFFNGFSALSNPSGSEKLPIHTILPLIPPHLLSTLHFLVGTTAIPLGWAIVPVVLTLLSVLTPVGKQRLLPWLTAGTLLSPVPLLCLFPIIPFERTWIHLAIPLAFSIGFMLTLLGGAIKRLPAFRNWGQAGADRRQPLLIGVYAMMFVVLFANFRRIHREGYAIDYDIRRYFQKLGPDIGHIHTIGYTGPGLEFYVADDLYFQCFKRNPKRQVTIWKRESPTGFDDDIFVVAPDSVSSFNLTNYQFVGDYGNVYSIYLRKY